MKRLLSVLLAAAMFCSFAACDLSTDVTIGREDGDSQTEPSVMSDDKSEEPEVEPLPAEDSEIESEVYPTADDDEISELIKGDLQIRLLTYYMSPSWDPSDVINFEGAEYYRVTDRRYDDWSEWESQIAAIYTGNCYEENINMGVHNLDGKTYCLGRTNSCPFNPDGEFSFEVTSREDSQIEVVMQMPYISSPYINGPEDNFDLVKREVNYYLEPTEQGWRIADYDRHSVCAIVNDLSDPLNKEISDLIEKDYLYYCYTNIPTLSSGSEYYEEDNYGYYNVSDETLDEWSEWLEFVNSIYTPEYADKKLENQKLGRIVIEHDGRTFVNEGGRGDSTGPDFAFRVLSESEDEIVVFCVRPDILWDDDYIETYTYHFVRTDDGLRISGLTEDAE